MANPTTREEFKTYCLRKLGWPVLEVNVDDLQLEDRVDDALRFWQEYHFDGTEMIYYSHQVSGTDITNKYLTLGTAEAASVLGISSMVNLSTRTSGMFSIKYQLLLNDWATYSTKGTREMQNYWMKMSHLSMIDDLINGMENIRFNRKTNKIYLDVVWGTEVKEGDFIVFETYQAVDENAPANAEVWNDMFLKSYATALIKEQWGINLSKFEGVQLPGGVTLNGRAILEDARTDIEALRDQMSLRFELPVNFTVG
jgi:hypothetical protein